MQLQPGFGFDEVAALAPYLAELGISHAYLSPVLQAAPGSTHGYDVVDHSALNVEHGGAEGFDRMVRALHDFGLGVVVDVVPNHVAVPTPEHDNQVLWSVLKHGPDSSYARWFDIDWTARQAVLIPVLGQRIGAALASGEIVVDRSGPEPVVRYHEHAWPVRPGTEDLPLGELIDAQHYRLAYWRVGDEELNYRRFFDVDTLVAIRVEDPAVFAESHALLIALVHEGKVDGLRIDHPDGLADPRAYLERLAEATDGAWVVVEKILEGREALPEDWRCSGTTGYDALRVVDGLFVDSDGLGRLVELHAELGEGLADFDTVAHDAKREVAKRVLQAEVQRLVEVVEAIGAEDIRLRDHSKRSIARAVTELLVAIPIYRAYVVPGDVASAAAVTTFETAVAEAAERVPDLADELAALRDLALGRFGRSKRKDEFVVRFQQTCGPVMAKGVEDTAFYRWYPLVSLCEVGGDPRGHDIGPAAFHEWATRQQDRWPLAMTTLSTHDTKRSEDLRMRLAVLTELPAEAAAAFTAFRWAAERLVTRDVAGEAAPSPHVEYLVWQNLVGAWPITVDRMATYVQKALREAKQQTSWQVVDEVYEAAVLRWLGRILDDRAVVEALEMIVARLEPFAQSNSLSAKLIQLTMPGVPDIYQGCEGIDRSLVDPDNRRLVDFVARARSLQALAGEVAGDAESQKLSVVQTALRLRRDRPDSFGAKGGFVPLRASGSNAEHAVAFVRGSDVLIVATRLAARLATEGGWEDTSIRLPDGMWVDALGGTHFSGDVLMSDLLEALPVALLVRTDETSVGWSPVA